MTQQELNIKVSETFDRFDKALEAAGTRREFVRITGTSIPSQNDVIQKFRNVFGSLAARAQMFGLVSTNLNDAIKNMPEEKEVGILE